MLSLHILSSMMRMHTTYFCFCLAVLLPVVFSLQTGETRHVILKDAPRVSLEIYYETLCPDSIDFIVHQLYPAFKATSAILNVTLVPFGIATEKKNGSRWEFTCQHGVKECQANIIQACALHLLPELIRSSKAIDFINCMELSPDPSASGPKCADETNVKYKSIENCAKGKQGNHLLHEAALQTQKLVPKLTWVPWIILNGVHTDEIETRASSDLLGLICDTYQGPKPSGCPSLKTSISGPLPLIQNTKRCVTKG